MLMLADLALPQGFREEEPSTHKLSQARDWLEDLAQFPIMTATNKAKLLKKIPQLPAIALDIHRSTYRIGVDVDDSLESQRINLTRNAETSVELHRAMRAGVTGPPVEGEGLYSPSDGDGLVWLAINALEIGLADKNETVKGAAQNCLETLLPSRFISKFDPYATEERTYRDFETDFSKELNVTYRRFGAANRDWLLKAGKKPEMLRAVAVFRSELKDESFRTELKELLESQDERRLVVAVECVAQWPDPEYLPSLDSVCLRGYMSAVVRSVALRLALNGYGAKAPVAIARLRPELDSPSLAHFLHGISRLPCQESWDLLVESLGHQAIEVRAAGMEGLHSVAGAHWPAVAGPNPNSFPSDAAKRVHSYALQTIYDVSPPVRIAAVNALDIKRADRSVWNRLTLDASPMVRLCLLKVLDQLDPEVAIDLSWGLLTDRDPEVRKIAFDLRQSSSDLTIRALRETRSPNPICREVAAKILALVAMTSYLEDVGPLLNDRVESVREAAAISLLSFGEKGFDLLLKGIGRLNYGSLKRVVDHLADQGGGISRLNQIAHKTNSTMRTYIARVIDKIQSRGDNGDSGNL